jgi:hypothetical protein
MADSLPSPFQYSQLMCDRYNPCAVSKSILTMGSQTAKQHTKCTPFSGRLCAAISLVPFLPSMLSAQQSPSDMQPITISAGVPLHVRVARTTPLRVGAPVEGVLTDPIYVYDRLVLPKGEIVHGMVTATPAADRTLRTKALLNGDVTPLRDPVVNFNSLHLSATNTDIGLDSRALIRDTQVVRFVPGSKRPSLGQKLMTAVRDCIRTTHDAIAAPGKKDRALKLLYGQLPYHPQRIWAGTQFTADLDTSATFVLPAAPRLLISNASSLGNVIVSARLADTLSSDNAKKGDTTIAIVTEPVFDSDHRLILPEGAQLEGSVLQSKPARSFGRNGQLRFAFSGVKREGEESQKVQGVLIGAAGKANQNLKVDDEGGVTANPDKYRFVAPLLLGVLATGYSRDGNSLGRNTVASNGFGLAARVVALTVNDKNVATGFAVYAFAKSIYFRYLTKGHQVSFPKDTMIEVQLSSR